MSKCRKASKTVDYPGTDCRCIHAPSHTATVKLVDQCYNQHFSLPAHRGSFNWLSAVLLRLQESGWVGRNGMGQL